MSSTADSSDKPMLRCTSCGMATEAACKCGVRYEIMRPGEAAERAVKAHPEKGDLTIANEIGVSDKTVARARKSTSTNVEVENPTTTNTRVGRDGRRRRMPNRRRQDKAMDKTEAARKIVRPLVEAGKAIQRDQLAKELGISPGTVQRAEMQERARLEGMNGDTKEKMVSIHVLIEKLVPLFERVRDQGTRHEALVSLSELRIIASEGRRLLDEWASDDETVRRVRGHVVPPKDPAKRKECRNDRLSL
jgi:hypothetical protein